MPWLSLHSAPPFSLRRLTAWWPVRIAGVALVLAPRVAHDRPFEEPVDVELEEAEADRSTRIDLLTFQTRELEALDLGPGEYDALMAERQRFRMSGQLVEGVSRIQKLLAEAREELRELGLAVTGIADGIYLQQEATVGYTPGWWPDTLWLAGTVAMFLVGGATDRR